MSNVLKPVARETNTSVHQLHLTAGYLPCAHSQHITCGIWRIVMFDHLWLTDIMSVFTSWNNISKVIVELFDFFFYRPEHYYLCLCRISRYKALSWIKCTQIIFLICDIYDKKTLTWFWVSILFLCNLLFLLLTHSAPLSSALFFNNATLLWFLLPSMTSGFL